MVINDQDDEKYPKCKYCNEEYPKDILVRKIMCFMTNLVITLRPLWGEAKFICSLGRREEIGKYA